MEQFIRNFYREGRGRWVCRNSCDYLSPVGPIHVVSGTIVHRGLSFRNFDLAAALDEHFEKIEPD